MATTISTADAVAQVVTDAVIRLSTAHTFEQVSEIAVDTICRVTGGDGATLVVADDETCFAVDAGAARVIRSAQRFPLTECLYGSVIRDPRVLTITDAGNDDRSAYDPHVPAVATTLCILPLRPSAPVGAIGVHWHHLTETSDTAINAAEAIAAATAVVVEKLSLRAAMLHNAHERDRALERCDELETAIHVVAHDLRRPLTSLLAAAELLADDVLTDPVQAAKHAELILRSGGRMTERIERMLALYRVTNAQVAPEPVDISSMARELADTLVEEYPARTIEFEVEDDLRATGDPVLIRVLLENLMSNAVKYTARTPEAQVTVGRSAGPSGMTTVVVRDNGAGFPQHQADKLFRPLSRLHDAKDFPGTGLGLASVARIVELHGGTVSATGRPGEGAEFYFSLPR